MIQQFSLPGIYPKEMETLILKHTCTSMFPAALFITAKTWKRPTHPLMEEWTKVWLTLELRTALLLQGAQTPYKGDAKRGCSAWAQGTRCTLKCPTHHKTEWFDRPWCGRDQSLEPLGVTALSQAWTRIWGVCSIRTSVTAWWLK